MNGHDTMCLTGMAHENTHNDDMKLDDTLQHEIIERLKPIHPEKVILFGSYAYGEPHKESDIDILVVTQDEYIPCSFKENMQNYLKVSSAIRDLRKRIPIDLIVHTKAMHEKFVEFGSLFSQEILSKGVTLL